MGQSVDASWMQYLMIGIYVVIAVCSVIFGAGNDLTDRVLAHQHTARISRVRERTARPHAGLPAGGAVPDASDMMADSALRVISRKPLPSSG